MPTLKSVFNSYLLRSPTFFCTLILWNTQKSCKMQDPYFLMSVILWKAPCTTPDVMNCIIIPLLHSEPRVPDKGSK